VIQSKEYMECGIYGYIMMNGETYGA